MSERLCVSCRHARRPHDLMRRWCARPLPGSQPSLVDGQRPVSGMWCGAEREPIAQPGWLARLFGVKPEDRCGPDGRYFETPTQRGHIALVESENAGQ